MAPRKTKRRSAPKTKDPFAELEQDGPRTVYAIDGDERFLVDELVRCLQEVAVPPAARDFNYESMVGKEVTLARVVDAALTLPAFAQRRMVLVRQADKLPLGQPEPLLRYLEEPSPTTVLVLAADKFDARSKVYKALQKAGAAVRFNRPKPREMPKLIQERARARGCKILPDAARLLAEVIDPDLTQAVQALELLELYVGPGADRPISSDDVAAVVRTAKEESVFDLVDAIGAGDREGVLRMLHRLMVAQREPGLRVLAMVARHFRHLLRARELLARGAPPSALASAIGLPPFLVDKLARQARRFDAAALVRGHEAIKHADRSLKSSRLADVRIMERLALDLMR